MKLSAPIHRLKHEAKHLAAQTGIPLHTALDRIAVREGYAAWSLLASRYAEQSPAARLYASLDVGDLLLVGARPGQGKTLMALQLAVEAARAGHRGVFFSLEYTARDIAQRFAKLGIDPVALGDRFSFDCSDQISAGYIIERMASAPAGAVVAIDYLQLLDQRRDTPPLAEQVRALKTFAATAGVIIVFISQIDRSFDPASKRLPDLSDIRLPNPVDLSLFSRACFLHDGEMQFAA